MCDETRRALCLRIVPRNISTSTTIAHNWRKPTLGWIKVNMDGARQSGTGETFCGGVGRDANMRWCFGFSKKINICFAFVAELWAIYEGLATVWTLSYTRVILETNCEEVYDCLRCETPERIHSSLRSHIGSIINKEWEVCFNCVGRRCNLVADKLVKMAKELPIVYHRILDPPSDILDLLQVDVDGYSSVVGYCLPL
ncbi:hypothetical protein V6N11_054023 [Hibiscus sabdariffa]|uniref:RNase H type-1 domain-containing protein n=1 Tax=Hibiscus sabdariffa TaxID=183260 RepID=A0ABR2S363_9ROSI